MGQTYNQAALKSAFPHWYTTVWITFLKPGANGSGMDRPKSPLAGPSEGTPAVAAAKPTVRKTTTGAAPKKNILGAKKKGLGAKKVVADGGLDFEEAERKAREEAERIEKLGYDPDAEAAEIASTTKSKAPEASNIAAPTPIAPARGGFGSTAKPERSSQDVERLGMGVARLGFGQVGAAAKKPAAQQKKMGGFGSVSKPTEMTAKSTRGRSLAHKRVYPATNSSAAMHSIPLQPRKPKSVCQVRRIPQPAP